MPQLGGGELGGFPLAGGLDQNPRLFVVDAGGSTDSATLSKLAPVAVVDAGGSSDAGSFVFHYMALATTDVGASADVASLRHLSYAKQGRVIRCTDPVTGHTVQFLRKDRSKLKWSSAVNGGDRQATWEQDCGIVGQIGFAAYRSRVQIIDTDRNKVNFNGIMTKPKEVIQRGKLVSIAYLALGVPDAEHREFPDHTTFGDTVGGFDFKLAHVSNDVHIISDIGDMMSFGLTQAPDVNGTQEGIATTGITLGADSEDFRGQTPSQLWSSVCALTSILGTPYFWTVDPDDAGRPALNFFAAPSTPEYFEHGNSKQNELEVDSLEIANKIYVIYNGNTVIQLPALTDPVDYSATPDLQTHVVNATDHLTNMDEAEMFAQGLFSKFSVRRATGGSITLDQPIRSRMIGASAPEIIPHEETRAGHVIRVQKQKTPYFDDVLIDLIIMSAEHDEDSCETTLSPTALNQLGRDARFISLLSNRAGFQWGLISTQLKSPDYVPPPLPFQSFTLAQLSDMDPNKPGDTPATTMSNQSTTTDGSGRKKPTGSPIPIGVDGPEAPATTPPIIRVLAGVPVAVTDEAHKWFGALGGKIHPQALPDQRVINPAIISTADPITGEITDGERASEDLLECWVDTLTARVLGGTPTTVAIHVDVYNWDTDLTLTDVFVIPLTGAAGTRIQLDGSDLDHAPVFLNHGDHAIYRIVGGTDDVLISVNLSGWKYWKEFPVLVGPDTVPGVS